MFSTPAAVAFRAFSTSYENHRPDVMVSRL